MEKDRKKIANSKQHDTFLNMHKNKRQVIDDDADVADDAGIAADDDSADADCLYLSLQSRERVCLWNER